jgi:SAM-dependent methyltransferase
MSEIFDQIYATNAWGGIESRSGPGSSSVEARDLAPDIVALVGRLRVTSVLDVGCGENFWTPDLPGYIGIDVSRLAIEVARQRHPERDLRLDDGTPYPMCDLVLVRCVIQHLSMADAAALLRRIAESGARWLLCTTYVHGANIEIATGGGYWPNMEEPPFSLGAPEVMLVDGRTDNHPDKGPMLGLWRIRWSRY